jgi:transcriptional regulator with XRE-family HTH domain
VHRSLTWPNGAGDNWLSAIRNGAGMAARRDGLKQRRVALGLTQEMLADRLGVERSTVSRWERGIEVPNPGSRCDIALALALPLEEVALLLADAPRSAGRLGDRVSAALRAPDRLDMVTVAELRKQVQGVDGRYDRMRSTTLLAEAGLLLGRIAFFGEHVADFGVRRQLRDVEAEAATLMGQLVWDASQRQDHDNARMYFDKAIEAARDTGNVVAKGHALLRKSYIALYGENEPKIGLDLTRETADVTAPVSHALTGLALLHTAEAHAMLLDRSACETSLAQAESHFDKAGPHDVAGFMLSPNQFGRVMGSCYLFLEDHQRAERILAATAQSTQPQNKSRAIVLGNLSLARLRRGELDGAAETLHEAINVVAETRGGGGMNLVFDAGRELGPWRGQKAVGDVYDRLLSLMTAA